jgi:beta-lactamase class A
VSDALLWERLSQRLTQEAAAVPAVAGLTILDLVTGRRVAVNGDEVFPTASTIKIHVLAQLFRRAEAGELDLSQRILVDRTMLVAGSGVLAYLEDQEQPTIRNLATLMIISSDNTATNLCIDLATMDGTNALLAQLGLEKTRVRRKMQDHRAVLRGDENTATPNEIVRFFEILHRAEGVSAFVSAETLNVLKKPKRGYLTPGLPPDIVIANKPGGMDRVRCDGGIIYLKRRPYAICVMTKYGLAHATAQETFIGTVARVVHETMATLDATSGLGQGVPADLLG